MAVVFLLGPGMWEPSKGGAPASQTPMDVRRKIAKVLRDFHHTVVLMENEPGRKAEDIIQKFDRLLRSKVTDVVLYWPPSAKMQTTYDELILLYDRQRFLRKSRIALWVLHHVSVAKITGDTFRVLEAGHRSRYLEAIARLGVTPLEWETDGDLEGWIQLLVSELGS